MRNEDKNCALCGALPEKEEPAILALGSYGYPRFLCEECERDIDLATLGKDYGEIVKAIDRLGKKTAGFGKDDRITLTTMQQILESSAKRASQIKDGSYDFSLDEAQDDGDDSFDEIPEELLESKEDSELDKRDAEFNKKMDKIFNWIWIAVFAGFAVFFILKFFVFK